MNNGKILYSYSTVHAHVYASIFFIEWIVPSSLFDLWFYCGEPVLHFGWSVLVQNEKTTEGDKQDSERQSKHTRRVKADWMATDRENGKYNLHNRGYSLCLRSRSPSHSLLLCYSYLLFFFLVVVEVFNTLVCLCFPFTLHESKWDLVSHGLAWDGMGWGGMGIRFLSPSGYFGKPVGIKTHHAGQKPNETRYGWIWSSGIRRGRGRGSTEGANNDDCLHPPMSYWSHSRCRIELPATFFQEPWSSWYPGYAGYSWYPSHPG